MRRCFKTITIAYDAAKIDLYTYLSNEFDNHRIKTVMHEVVGVPDHVGATPASVVIDILKETS